MRNVDERTVRSFGDEWTRFSQSAVTDKELQQGFEQYFDIFPWHALEEGAKGFDAGCGSGRWARFVAPRVGRLHCVDASAEALSVARGNLRDIPNCEFHHASLSELPFGSGSMDFGYALGVLHHIPDTEGALRECVRILKGRAPFLVYVYYALDDRPSWFRGLWRVSDLVRKIVSRMPSPFKSVVTNLIALIIYWPLARLANVLEKSGRSVDGLPLAFYRRRSFYTMRTDARDRFGTPLEKRFSAEEVVGLMERVGLVGIQLSESPPFWRALGFKASPH